MVENQFCKQDQLRLTYEFYINSNKEVVWNIITSKDGTEKIFYGAHN